MYKPFHLIGLELSISILSAALRGEPTGTTREWRADVVAVAKRDLAAGETLDGEGGYTVWGRVTTAAASRAANALPIRARPRGAAHAPGGRRRDDHRGRRRAARGGERSPSACAPVSHRRADRVCASDSGDSSKLRTCP